MDRWKSSYVHLRSGCPKMSKLRYRRRRTAASGRDRAPRPVTAPSLSLSLDPVLSGLHRVQVRNGERSGLGESGLNQPACPVATLPDLRSQGRFQYPRGPAKRGKKECRSRYADQTKIFRSPTDPEFVLAWEATRDKIQKPRRPASQRPTI